MYAIGSSTTHMNIWRGGNAGGTPDHFWSRVSKTDGCWDFQGARDTHGYGHLHYQGKIWRAHRLAFFLTHGVMPVNMVLHHCDNRMCCNPAHLYDGTHLQNMRDMHLRGRANPRSGFDHPEVTYTEAEAKEIARRYWEMKGDTSKLPNGAVLKLASEFGLHRTTIMNIAKRYKE